MRWTAPLLVFALALAACGDDDDDQADDTTAETTATSAEPGATTAAPVGDSEVVEVDELDVRFEAPEGWTTVDPEAVGDFSDDEVLAELAERTGVSTEALRNTMTDQVELFVFSGESEGEIASNINAIALPVADLPPAEQIEADFGTLGATDVEVETVEAAGGDALVVRYQLPLDEGRVAQGYGLFIDVGDEIVNLTVTAFTREEADQVGEFVRSTVTKSGGEAASEAAAPTTAADVSDDLAAVHERCTSDGIVNEYNGRHDDEVGRTYWGSLDAAAESESVTPAEYLGTLLDETFNADEETLVISGAWDNDSEFGTSEGGLLFGLVYDCALDSLDVPERVRSHITQTRALDGTQEDSWDDYHARWTYHPDDGINITIWKEQ